jgi:uncharacterized protein YdaU (DUF1376 family)
MNFYPFHIGDYLSHTSHLTDEEDLTYRRMIDLYYMTEAPFINDREWIARRVRSTPQIVYELLHEFFELGEDDLWHSARADKEIAKLVSDTLAKIQIDSKKKIADEIAKFIATRDSK